ncbi:Nonribosomal peptide synthetase 2 [Apiospora arundinis]
MGLSQAAGDYESALQPQQGLGSYESASDNNTPSDIGDERYGGHSSSFWGHETGKSTEGQIDSPLLAEEE